MRDIKSYYPIHERFSPRFEYTHQYYIGSWFEEGKKQPSSLVYKFGVLKISNQSQSIRKRIIHSGKATNLKADITIKQIAKLENGIMIEIPKERQAWEAPSALSWYRDQWDVKARMLNVDNSIAVKKLIEEWKHFQDNPPYLISEYLKNEVLDEIAVGREAFLLLFLTNPQDNYSFSPIWQLLSRSYGKYRFRVRISSDETHIDNLLYELEIRDWNNYTLTPLKNDS